jgi:hypothetical protein
MSSLRATFAEEVMLAIALRDVDGDDQAAVERFGTSIAPVVIAVVHLAQIALNEWLGDHDVTFEEIDPGTAGEY